MKIRILSDMGEVYDPGTEMEGQTLINDYIDVLDCRLPEEASCAKFLRTVDENTALQFIHDMWGIDYEEC